MIVIAEKINAARKPVAAAIRDRNAEYVDRVAREQVKAGADYIDVNGADPDPGKEVDNIAWLMEVVQSATDVPISIDTPSSEAMARGLALARQKPILNSISLETSRLEAMLPLLGDHDCMVVALLVGDTGPLATTDHLLKAAAALIEEITQTGKKLDEIMIDPGFFPLSVDHQSAARTLEAIRAIRRDYPEVHIVGGISNISYGLPKRRYLNLALMIQAIAAGMDYGIIDPCAPGAMGLVHAAEALSGRDEYCANYIAAARGGKLT